MPYKDPADETRRSKRYRDARKEESGSYAPFAKPIVNLTVKGQAHGLRIAVIPDTQVRSGVPLEHLQWCGKYLAKKQPDVIIQIGDFCDMSSLSFHDNKDSLRMEGKRYKIDIESAHKGMELLCNEINRVPGYKPTLLLTLGNHEDRIVRTVNADKRLEGLMSIDDLAYKAFGWTVFPFLQPITVGGVAFSHYFPSGVMGKPITTAKSLLAKMHMSAFAGHLQGRDIAYAKRADGSDMTAIISGSFYQHAEEYLSPFTNNHWRGMYFLHEVKEGSFDEMAVSIDYLKRRFAK